MKLVLSILFAVLLSTSSAVCQTPRNSTSNQPAVRPFNMLVLGDSVLWGEGLKPEHKSWYHVKLWIEKTTGRPVIEKIEAHSGAVIEGGFEDEAFKTTDGEVNLAVPTIREEVDRALQHYGDGSKVDLILVTGCVNDIGLQNLMNASGSNEITHLTEAKCGAPMHSLLQKITTSFPNADVIITGYYLFFSEKTRDDFVLRALARRFLKINPAAARLTRKESFERLISNSKAWHQASNKTLGDVVQRLNAELSGRSSRRQVMFTDVQFLSEYSFGSKKTRLWGFDRSPFRMMLLFLSFGKILLPSNDDVRGARTASCKEAFKQPANETLERKKEREYRQLLCRYAALGHPNKQGALLYSDAITNLLKTIPAFESTR